MDVWKDCVALVFISQFDDIMCEVGKAGVFGFKLRNALKNLSLEVKQKSEFGYGVH